MNSKKLKPFPTRVLLLCVCVGIVIAVLTAITPMVADDYDYSFDSWNGLRVTNMQEWYTATVRHYLSMNSRLLAHAFAYFFLMLPRAFFTAANGINAAFLSLTAYLTLRRGDTKKDCVLLAAFCAMVWLFMPAFGQIFLWLDGSCNYSWGLTFGMVYMLPFIRRAMNRETGGTAQRLICAVCAFIAGSYVENMAAAILFTSFLLMAYCFIRDRRMESGLVVDFLLCCGGFSVLTVFAPKLHAGVSLDIGDLISSLISRFGVKLLTAGLVGAVCLAAALLVFIFLPRTRKALLCAGFAGSVTMLAAMLYLTRPELTAAGVLSSTYWNLLIPALIYCLCFFAAVKKQRYAENGFIVSVILVLGAIVSVAVFLAAGYIPIRGFAVYTVFVSLAVLMLLPEPEIAAAAYKAAFCVLGAVFALSFIIGTADIYSLHRQAQVREGAIAEAVSEGRSEVYLKKYTYTTKYNAQFELIDIEPNPYEWQNQKMEQYYGISVIAEN